jgi:hypothetical protein
MKISNLIFLGVLCFVSLHVFIVSAAEYSVDFQDNKLRVVCMDSNLVNVLNDIHKVTGIRFLYHSIQDEKRFVRFDFINLEEGIKRLLHNFNYINIYDKNGNLTEVKVLGKKNGEKKGYNVEQLHDISQVGDVDNIEDASDNYISNKFIEGEPNLSVPSEIKTYFSSVKNTDNKQLVNQEIFGKGNKIENDPKFMIIKNADRLLPRKINGMSLPKNIHPDQMAK